ncbi:hypothetical protein ACFXOK_10400 [Streptomyces sp. NPDC059173]|uniref:hypothetical protein n=1 Tax=unclassified Streptomyces TaxID=2593676 RepID=UPI0034515CC5
MAISPGRKLMLGGATAALVVGLGATALAAPRSAAPAAPRAAADMPVAVEDFNYPGADGLLAERGIKLKRGDGHIILTSITDLGECRADTANIWVEAHTGTRKFCFHTNAQTGYLTMELPDTFNIWTGASPVQAKLTPKGTNDTTVVNAPADDLTSVGESGDTGLRSALVEIRVTG